MSDLNFDIFTENGIVPVPTFRRAVENSIYLLNQFDAGLSKSSRGVLDWFVDGIHSNGDGNGHGPHRFSIHFISHVKKSKAKDYSDFAPSVMREFLHGVREIETECETPPFLSENAMERVAEFGDMVTNKNASGFRFTSENTSVELTPRVSSNVEKLIGAKTTALGTITGRLETLDIHRGFKAKLYHEITNKVVTCEFAEDTFPQATEAFGKLVYVSGKLHKNIKGDTIRISHPHVEVIEDRDIYEIQQEALRFPSYVDTASTEEYMRRIRG